MVWRATVPQGGIWKLFDKSHIHYDDNGISPQTTMSWHNSVILTENMEWKNIIFMKKWQFIYRICKELSVSPQRVMKASISMV